MTDLNIQGIQETMTANQKTIMATKPTGPFGTLIRDVLSALHRFILTIVHVDTGALKAAQRMQWDGGAHGRIYTDPGAINPNGERPAVYGPLENARGGEHAFYDRTVDASPSLVNAGVHAFLNQM